MGMVSEVTDLYGGMFVIFKKTNQIYMKHPLLFYSYFQFELRLFDKELIELDERLNIAV